MKKALTLIHSIQRVFKKLFKIFQYIPVLWDDEDYDWKFIFTLLKYKLERTSACIIGNNVLTKDDQNAIAKQIRVTIKLLDRAEKDRYSDYLERSIIEKFGENFYSYLSKSVLPVPADYDTRFSELEKAEISKLWAESCRASGRMRSRDIDRAMRIMAKYMEGWWD